ncbi:MAG: hypothetical protein ACOX2O_04490 [Bdellovibrionota bacterium]|jgi:hypothetical protein
MSITTPPWQSAYDDARKAARIAKRDCWFKVSIAMIIEQAKDPNVTQKELNSALQGILDFLKKGKKEKDGGVLLNGLFEKWAEALQGFRGTILDALSAPTNSSTRKVVDALLECIRHFVMLLKKLSSLNMGECFAAEIESLMDCGKKLSSAFPKDGNKDTSANKFAEEVAEDVLQPFVKILKALRTIDAEVLKKLKPSVVKELATLLKECANFEQECES